MGERKDDRQEKRSKGLFGKFIVARADGRDKPGEKHCGCQYFVLDCTHDPFAIPAIRAYAEACRNEYPVLSEDLRKLAAKADGSRSESLKKRVLRVTQSPMNKRRWILDLECGHELWVTSLRRPKAQTAKCERCA